MKLQDYLHEERETQRDFARRVGLNESQVSRLVNGRYGSISTNLARLIIFVTGGKVTANDLLE